MTLHRQRETEKTGGKRKARRVQPQSLTPTPLNDPSVVLFQECSYGRWFPLAGTCEDSARSGPGGDLQFYTHTHRPNTLILNALKVFPDARTERRVAASTDLLMNCSRPTRLSSMKDSSKRPSSERKGSCLDRALVGRDGTTIWERQRPPRATEETGETGIFRLQKCRYFLSIYSTWTVAQ